MKKVTLLMLESERIPALHSLRDLGIMHLEQIRPVRNGDASRAGDLLNQVSVTVRRLERMQNTVVPSSPRQQADWNRIDTAMKEIDAAAMMDLRDRLTGDIAGIRKNLDRLEPWGDFDRADLEHLRRSGIDFKLCRGTESDLHRLEAIDGIAVEKISEKDGKIFFAMLSDAGFPKDIAIPDFPLKDEDNPAELRRKLNSLEAELNDTDEKLSGMLAALPAMKAHIAALESEYEFALAGEALYKQGTIASLTGFVPVPELPRLENAAAACGWGLLVEDPAPDDRVPTLLKLGKFTRAIQPLFKFLGIAPGYDEIDVSTGFLLFFTVFTAIIIGDGGYGLLMTAAAVAALCRYRNRPAAALPVRLFLILGIATTLWGLFTGNIFGTAPDFLRWAQIPALAIDAMKDRNTQFFCFLLAAGQLSLGHIWQAVAAGNLRCVLRNLGWMLILWGNFFLTERLLVYPGDFPTYMYWLYGTGLLLVMIFDVNWRNIADVFQFPSNVINSFVDVLSYIRLFAVGMAGYYIAVSINGMGRDLCGLGWLAAVFGVLVVVLGHGLNIILCAMSVLVHGIRLNTLEFSNHAGLRWGGCEYKPFAGGKQKKEK